MEDAARRLGELLAGEKEAGARLTVLQQYRAEYHQRFVAAAQNGIDRTTWNNYRSFLDRLDEAISQAIVMVDQSRQLTVAGQREWVDKRGRVKAFDTLSQRHQNNEQRVENRQEQKLQDEHAARTKPSSDEE
jgi:flagellar FliJ protein